MRTRGTVDNHNNYQARSLNKTKRQRELLRLTHENQVKQPNLSENKIWLGSIRVSYVLCLSSGESIGIFSH